MGTCHQVVRSITTRCTTLSTLLDCLLCLLSPHLLYIQHLLLYRSIILILGRLTWEVMVSTRIPTATWSRRWCSRTSASPTQRLLATRRTRSRVLPSRSTIVQE